MPSFNITSLQATAQSGEMPEQNLTFTVTNESIPAVAMSRRGSDMSDVEGVERADQGSENSLINEYYAQQLEEQSFLDQLPDISTKDLPNDTVCHICMDEFGSTEDPEPPVKLPCGHVIGRKCISRWLKTKNSCPLCRRVVLPQDKTCHREEYLALHREEYLALRRLQFSMQLRLSFLELMYPRRNSLRRRETLEIRRRNNSLQSRLLYLCVRYPSLAGLGGDEIYEAVAEASLI